MELVACQHIKDCRKINFLIVEARLPANDPPSLPQAGSYINKALILREQFLDSL